MKRSIAAVIFLVCVFLGVGFSATPSGAPANDALVSLERKTVLLNFVNGLHLTLDQVDTLYSVGCEAESLRARFVRETRTARQRLEQALRALQPYLMHEQAIPDSLKRVVHRAKAVLQTRRSELRAGLAKLARRSTAVLTENQLHLVAEFRPCLIPPSTGAIGQDRALVPKQLERTLRRVRQVPAWRYPSLKRKVIREQLARERERGLLRDSTAVEKRRRSLDVFLEDVRRMDEPDFLRKLPTLVEALQMPPGAERAPASARERAWRFLSDPQVLPILGAKKGLLEEQMSALSPAGER